MSSELERMATLAEKSDELIETIIRKLTNPIPSKYMPIVDSVISMVKSLGLSNVAPIKKAQGLQAVFETLKPYCEPKFKEGK